MHKRKHDWPITVLRYRAYPRTIPQSLWDTAKAQHTLWNQLVELYETLRLLDSMYGVQDFWPTFNTAVKQVLSRSPLDWVNGPDIVDRFRSSLKHSGRVRLHGVLDRIAICHRFTSGGIQLAGLIDNTRAQRLKFKSSANWQLPRREHSPNAVHWRVHFKVGDDTIDGTLALNRPLPPDAILKRAAWLGERAADRWFWHLALTVEQPPPPDTPAGTDTDTRPTAALDLGWRLFADGSKRDYVRVGMLADSAGHLIELRLPLWLTPNRPQEWRGLPTLAEWQVVPSALVECGKALAGNRTLNRRGLGALLDKLDPETRATLQEVLGEHDRACRRIAHLRFQLIQRRRWYYQNLAQWICHLYSTIAIEDMELAQLHQRSNEPALRNAAQYRNYAAVGELRTFLRRAAARTATLVKPGESSETTSTCWQCAALVKPGASLGLTCPNGHQWDQDQNAARNLLAQLDGSFRETHDLRKFRVRGRGKEPDIPDRLRTVAVMVLPK
jgi:transposase